MGWIIDHLGFIIFLAIAISIGRKVRAFLKRIEEEAGRHTGTARPTANFDPDEAERVRRIQEEIRRKIAERRGGDRQAPHSATPAHTERPPLLSPTGVPPLDPFGGPIKRIFAELERRAQASMDAPP